MENKVKIAAVKEVLSNQIGEKENKTVRKNIARKYGMSTSQLNRYVDNQIKFGIPYRRNDFDKATTAKIKTSKDFKRAVNNPYRKLTREEKMKCIVDMFMSDDKYFNTANRYGISYHQLYNIFDTLERTGKIDNTEVLSRKMFNGYSLHLMCRYNKYPNSKSKFIKHNLNTEITYIHYTNTLIYNILVKLGISPKRAKNIVNIPDHEKRKKLVLEAIK